jgi:hypothetical protein
LTAAGSCSAYLQANAMELQAENVMLKISALQSVTDFFYLHCAWARVLRCLANKLILFVNCDDTKNYFMWSRSEEPKEHIQIKLFIFLLREFHETASRRYGPLQNVPSQFKEFLITP